MEDVKKEVKFLRDCRQHANVVDFYGCYSRKVARQIEVWIAMEYCGGGSIESCYKTLRKPLTEPEIAHIMKECLIGLISLHSDQKIHRDVKCANILLTEDGRVKFADFGVSAQLTQTLTNTLRGSPYWMAPEVISSASEGLGYSSKADIWSLGITAMEMAECNPPRINLDPRVILHKIVTLERPTLKTPHCWSHEFHDFLEQCLQKDPKRRDAASVLIDHPFIKKHEATSENNAVIQSLMQRTKDARSMEKTNSEALESLFFGLGLNTEHGSDGDNDEEEEGMPDARVFVEVCGDLKSPPSDALGNVTRQNRLDTPTLISPIDASIDRSESSSGIMASSLVSVGCMQNAETRSNPLPLTILSDLTSKTETKIVDMNEANVHVLDVFALNALRKRLESRLMLSLQKMKQVSSSIANIELLEQHKTLDTREIEAACNDSGHVCVVDLPGWRR
ncbi:UNVERIFIED_CONTAM: Serine/threonine-protein kinase 4 [Siphonaria sp. JEL0065]|nr:Serine/threonine-protein kinase 4 [Siphonaria sp. JEL0065]